MSAYWEIASLIDYAAERMIILCATDRLSVAETIALVSRMTITVKHVMATLDGLAALHNTKQEDRT